MPLARLLALACCGGALRTASQRLITPRWASRLASPRASMTDSFPPRVLLTSSGLTSPSITQSFHRLLEDSRHPDVSPRIVMVVTAQLAPSVRESSVDSSTGPRRSPGELRRRRWADARKKGRVISKELGVPVECIDCIRSDSGELRAALERSNCIWVTGGNTFFLWQAMRHSGLDGLIQQRVAAGALYVGCSAGAIVAGCSIETAFWKGWDDPSVAPEMDWKRPSNLQGMGLVNASFFPHFDSSWAPLVEQKRSELGHMLVCLDEMNAFVTGNESSGSLGGG